MTNDKRCYCVIPQALHRKKTSIGVSITRGSPKKSTSKAWSVADRNHQVPAMALWTYGFLVVSAELSGQNATFHGRNLERLVDCGVCKDVLATACKFCDGTGGPADISSASQPRRRTASSSYSQPRRRSSGGSSPSSSQPSRRRLPACAADFVNCGVCMCTTPAACAYCDGKGGKARILSYITEKPEWRPDRDIFSTGVLVLMLLSCVAFVAWCLWKRRQEKKDMHGADPDLELQAAPGPGEVFQISAEWPRGKVAFFTIESGAFEAFGHRYSIEHPNEPQLTKFHWADGTVQTLVRTHRNSIEWQTNHSQPEWQRFLWVCAFPNLTNCCAKVQDLTFFKVVIALVARYSCVHLWCYITWDGILRDQLLWMHVKRRRFPKYVEKGSCFT